MDVVRRPLWVAKAALSTDRAEHLSTLPHCHYTAGRRDRRVAGFRQDGRVAPEQRTSAVCIRAYRADDQESVLRLWEAAVGSTWPLRAGVLAATVAELDGLVACAGKAVVGYVAFSRRHGGNDESSLVALLVDTSRQRHGLGSRLLGQAIAQVASAGAGTLTLGRGDSYFWPGVPENLPAGAGFFRRRGLLKPGG